MLNFLPLALIGWAAAGWVAVGAAAEPANGTLTPESGPLVYTIAPFVTANATPVPLVDLGPTCGDPAPECDSYSLVVNLPEGYAAAHNADTIKVRLEWEALTGQGDYDMYIYNGDVTSTSGGDNPPNRSASGANPEIATIFPLLDGENHYTIKVVPYTPGGEELTVTISIESPGSVDLDPNFGQPDATVAGVPRYQTFAPTNGVAGESSNGEYNIGYNVHTGKIMVMAFGNGSVFRITPPESLSEPLPEACQGLWEDATPLATSGPQPVADPIMFTDRVSGRTWASNLTVGPNVSYAFSDDDGYSWVEAGAGGLAGADHQTIGSGPYPADSIFPHPLHENAVYFCSQAIVGPAGCVRSDDGGLTYSPATLAYDGSVCGGLHGHVRVAPNGTVWLPVASCGSGTGASVSTDAGITWNDFMMPFSEGQGDGGSDPSIALDDDSTAYFCYADGDGHIRAAVSSDNGATWTDNVDLGDSHGIVNSAFPEAWGGSSGRAACAFLGTNQPGDLESIDFPGLWYGFVAHTYDGGKTWTTVNVTPNDPVQGLGGIWHGGGSNPNRNLLDFNEITADERGRVLFGYDDGCVRECADDPRANPQSFTALMKVARQTGGRSLQASEDVPEPRSPAQACLAGARSDSGAILVWQPGDNGGADIVNYKVFRRNGASGTDVFLGDTGTKTRFVDTTAEPGVSTYVYTITAENAAGVSLPSNAVELMVSDDVIDIPNPDPVDPPAPVEPPPANPAPSNSRRGGSLGWLTLLLLGPVLIRRRKA